MITWQEIDAAALALVGRVPAGEYAGVWGIPTGGSVIAPFIARHSGMTVLPEFQPGALVVDDLVDSGRTLRPFLEQGATVDALFRKPTSPADLAPGAQTREGWLHFPWERAAAPEDAVVRLLEFIGEDPRRDGLLDTPARVTKSLRELTAGYAEKPAEILAKCFDISYDEMVVVRGVRFTSLCEHHLLPFMGEAAVGYIPGKKVVGLSKLARLVECFARRLQVQERMTNQITAALVEQLEPLGAACVIEARHLCMGCRGVRQGAAEMVTSSMLGSYRDKPEVRAEFFALTRARL